MLRLCSTSQTRALLLRDAGTRFVQCSVDFDEDALAITDPKSFVYHATLGKYRAALSAFDYREMPLLVADTVVMAQGKLLRKAKDADDVRAILHTQSGNITSILTCMIYKSAALELIDLSATHYLFDPFDCDDIEAYIRSNEWQGKAGACMVEGFCKRYIREVRGFESTAMGLSVEVLKAWIQ
ncbi:MAG: septum formation inhibitor Maf [Campylobacterales bacterium]|nr:septum formation inhibitor Maf [Campylobacterales bacterium]